MSRLEELLEEATQALWHQNDPDHALSKVQQALILSPSNPDVWLLLGNVLTEKNCYVEAMDCYSLAMKYQSSTSENISLRKADLYTKMGNIALAMQEYMSVLPGSSSHVHARIGLANCFYNINKFDRAKQEYEIVIREYDIRLWTHEDVRQYYSGLSKVLWKQSQHWSAIKTAAKGFLFDITCLFMK
ncbi:MAG: tetratricopeptide repeat protein [Nanoarchaeota archaeon]